MAKGTKGGSVYVDITLDKDQFDKDFKAAQREISAVQKQLSLEMERNKVKFAVEGMDKNWADKMFGDTVIGKIRTARKETQFLNDQIGYQRNKTDIAAAAWKSLVASNGATSAAAVTAEKSFLREQMALVGLNSQLNSTTSASSVMGGAVKTAAATAAAAVVALAAAYATAAKSAVAWGQAVNDIVDETGMADQSAARLLGTMNIVGISGEEAAGAIAKLAKNINTASTAQAVAAKNGKDSEDVFTKYGIAIKGADGQLLNHEQILANIQEVHRNMQDGLQKTSMEMELFGKTGYKMNDFLNLSQNQMDEYTQKLDKMGLAISDSAKYEDLNRQLNEMKLALVGIAVTITGDDIPAITQLISKLTEFSMWIKENKDGLDDFKNTIMTVGGWMAKPFTIGMEITVAALKKYVESVDAAAKASKNPLAGDSTLDDISAAAKMAEANLKKQSDAARAKAAAEKDLIFAQRDLNDAVMTLQGKTLAVTLLNINREREAWINKTKDEVAASQWAEAAKTKAFKDAIDSRLGEEVKAAKDAIKNGTDVSEAIRKASENRKIDEQQTYDAQQAVKDYYGLKAPGDTKTTLQVDALAGVITSFKELVKDVVIPRDKNGRTVFDQYQPVPGGNVIPGQNLTVTNNINIERGPNDNEDALAQKVAQKIVQRIDQAQSSASKAGPQ